MNDLHSSDLIGAIGIITVPIEIDRPGEILLSVRGGSEAYTAISDEPIVKHSQAIVVEVRSARSVFVTPFA